MASDKPPSNVLPFGRVWRFPADLDRLRARLDDDEAEFEEAEVDDGFACAEAAIAKGVAGGHEAKADLLNMRAHRILTARGSEAALAAWAELIDLYPTYLDAYVERATLLGNSGDQEAALAELDRFIARSPTDARGYLHRAKRYQARGDAGRALANFRRALQLDPESFDEHLSMALLLTTTGDAEGAARVYAQYAEQELGDAESYKLRAFTFFVAGQEELALADYEASVALSPSDPDALSWRGLCRLRLGHLDGAIADFTRLISMKPLEAGGFQRRGEALERAGKYALALADLERAITLGGDEKGAAHFARGKAQEALGDVAAALASYDSAISRDPSNVACRLRRFAIHEKAENWAACRIDVIAMLESAPNERSLLLGHARLCVANNLRQDARAAYDRLIELEPKNVEAYVERSRLLVGLGVYVEACADAAKAFELAPDDPAIRSRHGRNQAQFATTDEERAAGLALIASAAELDAKNPAAWARAAVDIRDCGFPDKAIPFMTRAIELDPDNAAYFDERSVCRRCAASPSDPVGFQASVTAALADLESAFALAVEEDPERYARRAELREDAGDLAGAIADHTKTIEMDATSMEAHQDRARLRKLAGDMPGALADAARVAALEDEWFAEVATWPNASQFDGVKRFNLDEA